MYKTPSNFHIGMRGGAPDLCSPLKVLFTDWRLIPLDQRGTSGDDNLPWLASTAFLLKPRYRDSVRTSDLECKIPFSSFE
jgi:hypothetical protein